MSVSVAHPVEDCFVGLAGSTCSEQNSLVVAAGWASPAEDSVVVAAGC